MPVNALTHTAEELARDINRCQVGHRHHLCCGHRSVERDRRSHRRALSARGSKVILLARSKPRLDTIVDQHAERPGQHWYSGCIALREWS
jgi:hypothetical protein